MYVYLIDAYLREVPKIVIFIYLIDITMISPRCMYLSHVVCLLYIKLKQPLIIEN